MILWKLFLLRKPHRNFCSIVPSLSCYSIFSSVHVTGGFWNNFQNHWRGFRNNFFRVTVLQKNFNLIFNPLKKYHEILVFAYSILVLLKWWLWYLILFVTVCVVKFDFFKISFCRLQWRNFFKQIRFCKVRISLI